MEDVLVVRDDYRLQSWVEIIRERQESGLTNKEFCARRGIPEKKYYYWLRKVRAAAAEAAEPQLSTSGREQREPQETANRDPVWRSGAQASGGCRPESSRRSAERLETP